MPELSKLNQEIRDSDDVRETERDMDYFVGGGPLDGQVISHQPNYKGDYLLHDRLNGKDIMHCYFNYANERGFKGRRIYHYGTHGSKELFPDVERIPLIFL